MKKSDVYDQEEYLFMEGSDTQDQGDAAFLWPKAHESTSALDRGRVLVGHQLQEIDMESMKGQKNER